MSNRWWEKPGDRASKRPKETLTDKQLLVVGRLSLGDSYKEIASQLGISEHAVQCRLRSARASFGARSNAHLMWLIFRGVHKSWTERPGWGAK